MSSHLRAGHFASDSTRLPLPRRFDAALSRYFGGRPPTRRVILRKVVVRALLVLLALGAGYILVANWALSRLEGWVTGEDFILSYESAHTVWPGRVEVEKLALRTSDSNVQIELRVARASVDVDLLALASKRFHALWAETRGTEFRMRHKHAELGDAAPRIAAYPPIDGFEGPPLRMIGPPPPAGETWKIRMENVTARVPRLWFVEYHYHGAAVAQGAFELHPGRFLELEPSHIRFEGGTLQVGEAFVARKLEGTLHARIEPTDLQRLQGTAMFFPMTARADLELFDGDLAFAEVYTTGRLPVTVQGPFDGTVRGGLIQGALRPDTRIGLSSSAATIRANSTEVTGDWSFRLEVDAEHSPAAVRLSAASRRSVASGDDPPTLHETLVSVAFSPLEVYEPLRRERFDLKIGALEVPDLGWFTALLPGKGVELGGNGRLRVDYANEASSGASGTLALSYEDVAISTKDLQLDVSGRANGKFVSEANTWVAMNDVHWDVQRGKLGLNGDTWGSWSLGVRSNSVRLLAEPFAFQSTMDVRATRSGELVELALPDLPAKLAASLFDLEDLEARIAFFADERLRRLEVLEAKSGEVRAEGVWAATPDKSEGSISFETPVADFQVLLDGGRTRVSLGTPRRALSLAGF